MSQNTTTTAQSNQTAAAVSDASTAKPSAPAAFNYAAAAARSNSSSRPGSGAQTPVNPSPTPSTRTSTPSFTPAAGAGSKDGTRNQVLSKNGSGAGSEATKVGAPLVNGRTPMTGEKEPASRDKRLGTAGVTMGHKSRPSTSAISFGSLAQEKTGSDAILSSANPPSLSQRDPPTMFGTVASSSSPNPVPASSSDASKKLADAAAPSAAAGPTATTGGKKKKYDFNAGFQAAGTTPPAATPSTGSSPSPSVSFRPDPMTGPAGRRTSASTYDPSNGSNPASPRPLAAPLGPGPGGQGSFGGSHLSGASQAFTPGGVRGPPGPQQMMGGQPGWQGGPPQGSPHYQHGQLPYQGGPPGAPPPGFNGQRGGPGGVPFSPRNSLGPGGHGPAGPPGSPISGRPSLGASQGGGGRGPASPRIPHAHAPGAGGPNGTVSGVTGSPGFQSMQPVPGFWQPGPQQHQQHPGHQQPGMFGGPPQQGGAPYGQPGAYVYHPGAMPTYPFPHPQQHPQHHQPHHPMHMQQSPQPPHQPLPGGSQAVPPPPGSAVSTASTPSLAPARTPGSSMVPPASPAPSTPGFGGFPGGSGGPGPHSRTTSLSYTSREFVPGGAGSGGGMGVPGTSELNHAAPMFTPRKSAAIAIKKPEPKLGSVAEEEEKKKQKEEEAAVAKKKEEEEAAAKKKAEEEEAERRQKEAAAAKKAEEQAAEKKRLEEEAAEKKRKEEEEAAEKERLRLEKEAKEKAEREEKERLEREAKDKAEREAKEKEEKEAKEKEKREAKEKEERVAKEKDEREAQERAEADAKAKALQEEKEKREKKPAAAAASKDEAVPLPDPASLPGLPSRPINGVGVGVPPSAKARPSPIDVSHNHTRSMSSDIPSALPSALQSARKIEDLNQVSYPENIRSPQPELNADAVPGKFRYDRGFLLQFMSVCTEKPDQLPSLEAIGMIDQPSEGGLPRSQSFSGNRRGPSGAAPPLARGVSGTIAPLSGTARVGSGGMTIFGATPARTSEERFAQANAIRSAVLGQMPMGSGFLPGRPASGQMSRPPSTHGLTGIASCREGRRSGRGQARGTKGSNALPPTIINGEPIAPLQQSANSWGAARGATLEENSTEMVQRKVKSLLNKLTLDKFDSISQQVLDWANKSESESDGRILRIVIALIFEKATDEAHWSEMYARLCRMLMERVSGNVKDENVKDAQGNSVAGGNLFRKYLLNRCQEDYEKGWAKRDATAAAAAGKAEEDGAKQAANVKSKTEAEAAGKSEPAKEADLLSDEYYAAQKAKRQGLGLVRFIGELFKLSMLTERIMHECIKKLLSNIESPEEEDIESLCRLMTTVGKLLDHDKATNHINIYFARMNTLVTNQQLSSRARFMVQDVIDMRKNGWVGRNEPAGPKLISQIHEDAAKAAAESARQAASAGKGLPRMNEQMPRGGSRGGQRRDQFAGVGADGWAQVAPPQRPTKAGDLSHFGKIRDASGSGRPTFGPSGVFANKGRKDGKATPERDTPVSVASNPFAALNSDTSHADVPPSLSRRSSAADISSSTSSRPKLQLAPRTLPLPKQAEEPVVEEESVLAEETMTDETADRKVKNSVEEFFSVKSIEEGEASFEALPPSRCRQLVRAMAEKAIDMKVAEVQLTASLFQKLATNRISNSAFIQAFESIVEQIDDLGVDNPSAFRFCGMLLKAAGLDEAAVKALSEKMEALDDLEEAQERLMEAFKNASFAS